MKIDLAMKKTDFSSSFLSCEKDCQIILRKLFIESQPYSNYLTRLLVINTNDCLDNTESEIYKEKVKEMTLPKLISQGYIKLAPKIKMSEHEEVKSYIYLNFDILCHTDYWYIGNYRLRPLKIAGYIDGILNKCKLTGIGTLEFLGCNQIVLDEVLSGYTLSYRAVHGSDDKLEAK